MFRPYSPRRILKFLLVLTLCGLWFGCGGGSPDQMGKQGDTSDQFSGFQVDMSALNAQQKAIAIPEYANQIQVIQKANLPVSIYEFMKTVPIVADPTLPLSGTPALFSAKGADKGVVKSYVGPMPSDKPILLHEMLHAYDWNYWKFALPEVTKAYTDAMTKALYPDSANSHFLENASEFFAISGTIYLVGSIQQPPYNCKALTFNQTDYVKFLETIFGKHPYCN